MNNADNLPHTQKLVRVILLRRRYFVVLNKIFSSMKTVLGLLLTHCYLLYCLRISTYGLIMCFKDKQMFLVYGCICHRKMIPYVICFQKKQWSFATEK